MIELTISPAVAQDVYSLRQSILHPEKDSRFSQYPADCDSTTMHLGAYLEQELVGIASIFQEPIPGRADATSWRLRDMGVLESLRCNKVGSALLKACLAHIAEKQGTFLWCYARSSAVEFYLARDFQVENNPIQLQGFGQRFLMWQTLG